MMMRRVVQKAVLAAGFALVAASCAPGTEGIVLTSASETDDQVLGDTPIEVVLPHIPVIALPDLSSVGDYDQLLQDRLGSLSLQPIDGVEVVTAECDGGEAVLEGDQSSDLFDVDEVDGSFSFSIDPDTAAAHYSRTTDGVRTQLRTNGDGSGEFLEEHDDGYLSIVAQADGSGRYYAEAGGTITTVEADAVGAGVYYDQGAHGLTTITIGADGSGALFNETDAQLLTIDARPDGSGDLYIKHGDRVVTIRVRSDRSWELVDSANRNELTVKVLADGSGSYRQRGDAGSLSLDFDTAGVSQWRGAPGPPIVLPEAPAFVVASRFPALGNLATIAPPCATVLRFDSQVLFAVNEHDVLPEAAAVLAEVAPALIDANRTLEVNGHTDANGTDDYNLALSQRRAAAVAELLRSLGVDAGLMTVNGYGESLPVAENYHADGSDDEAGQRQNRRVEIVIHG